MVLKLHFEQSVILDSHSLETMQLINRENYETVLNYIEHFIPDRLFINLGLKL